MQLSESVALLSASNQVDILVVENDLAEARISLYGGHTLSYKPKRDHRERLWESQDAVLDGTKAIRGGIPVCWPWFGDHPSKNWPAHGYMRTQQWHVVECVDSETGSVIKLKPEFSVGPGFDGNADLTLTVSVGNELSVQLTTKNVGAQSFEFGGALHSYFNIEDISQTQLHGLTGDFLDKTENYARKVTPEAYRFHGETDNIHLSTESVLTIRTPGFSIDIESLGQDSIVVWNPWIEKSQSMTDMPDYGYQFMLCVESAITQGVTLAVNEQHTLTQVIK